MYGSSYYEYEHYPPYRPAYPTRIDSPRIIIRGPRPSSPGPHYKWIILMLNKWIIKFNLN